MGHPRSCLDHPSRTANPGVLQNCSENFPCRSVAELRNTRSFDCVRLSPHFAQDDREKQVPRIARDDNVVAGVEVRSQKCARRVAHTIEDAPLNRVVCD